MKNYNLGFISNNDIAEHVRNTVMQYSRSIDLKAFKKNNIDAIKLTFDAKIYGKSFEEIIDSHFKRYTEESVSFIFQDIRWV